MRNLYKHTYVLLLIFSLLIRVAGAQNILIKNNTSLQYINTHLKSYYTAHGFYSESFAPDSLRSLSGNYLHKKNLGYLHHTKKYRIAFQPLASSRAGTDLLNNDNSYHLAAGIGFGINYKNKLTLGSALSWHGFAPFNPTADYIEDKRVHPHGNIVHNSQYPDLRFTLNYKANRYISLEAGMGEHFIGKGYRSLLLSDDGFAYPYFKINTSVWNIEYTNLWTQMKDIQDKTVDKWWDFDSKYMAMHYLSWQIVPAFRLGLFEAVVWKDENRGFDIKYLNPVLFYRPLEFDLGSPDNVLLGVDMDIKIKDHLIYTQLMLDEFKIKEIQAMNGWWGNKQSFQLGWRWFDMLNIKHLNLLLEGNYIRPYMYSHDENTQNYGHINQSIAHPLGSNVAEIIMDLAYSHKLWYWNFNLVYSLHGENYDTLNLGGDIYMPYTNYSKEYNNFVGQGDRHDLLFAQLSAHYLLNPSIDLNLFSRLSYRHLNTSKSMLKERNVFFEIGLRAGLKEKVRNFL